MSNFDDTTMVQFRKDKIQNERYLLSFTPFLHICRIKSFKNTFSPIIILFHTVLSENFNDIAIELKTFSNSEITTLAGGQLF